MPEAYVIAVVAIYVGLLLLVALWAERQDRRTGRVGRSAIVYVLAQAVYCTTWTYYGSVGLAASSGFLFLTIYLGPTICIVFWWIVLRRMVRIKERFHVTSLADLLSLRYGRSQAVGALATAVAVFGLVPYVALQLKTMIVTVSLVAGHDASRAYPAIGQSVGPPLVLLMLIFTLAFGLRRAVPTERHPGMMAALALASVVKLAAFLAVGVFVTYKLFDGFGEIFLRANQAHLPGAERLGAGGASTWISHLILAGSAILFLPRQFHVAVVENSDHRHIRTAMWLLPAYLLVINVFVLPVALGGLLLGHSLAEADFFVLHIPYEAGQRLLSWFVFLGGLSAGTGMIVVETMALATMVSNQLIQPAMGLWQPLDFLRRRLLLSRWVAAAAILCAAFAYERVFGHQYELVSIGLVSFAAVLQLAPSALAGLFWPLASTAGAFSAVAAGFAVWAYTLVLPVMARARWISEDVLSSGPFGISLLRPEALFGVGGLDHLTHSVLWSLIANVGALVLGSLIFPSTAEERQRILLVLGTRTVRKLSPASMAGVGLALVDEKRVRVVKLFSHYYDEPTARRLAAASLLKVSATSGGELSPLQLAQLQAEVETALAASIGAAAAHAAIGREHLITPIEARAVSASYAEMLAALKVSPAELKEKIDYHREREKQLAEEAANERFLADATTKLAASLHVNATARVAVHLAVPRLADAALLWFQGQEEPPSVWFAHLDPQRERTVEAEIEGLAEAFSDVPTIALARSSRRTAFSGTGTGWPPQIRVAGPRWAEITLPLVGRRDFLGTLSLFSPTPRDQRPPRDLALAEELARRCAVALENASLYRRAEQAVQARDQFLAVASHEIKTPLTPLRLSVQALRRIASRGEAAKLPPQRVEEVLLTAERQILRLVALVDELLDLSRITTRRLRLEPQGMDLAEAVRNVVERYRDELSRAGCEVTICTSEAATTGVWDRSRLEQVITNLLTNGIKYAPNSRIHIDVECGDGLARLRVRDDGPGIAPEDQARIFQPYERAASYLNVSGFGLGLFIVREIVEAHGGTIRVESAPGRGTAFVVELPRRPASGPVGFSRTVID
jgi:signal transduction histidine kinase/Na+/proline symporter